MACQATCGIQEGALSCAWDGMGKAAPGWAGRAAKIGQGAVQQLQCEIATVCLKIGGGGRGDGRG